VTRVPGDPPGRSGGLGGGSLRVGGGGFKISEL
jgi:hypothetical protein